MTKERCMWAKTNELLTSYHDKEWGVPLHDNRELFEFLNLEGAQAGLSWLTVLKKRDYYRKVFNNFDPYVIAYYDHDKRAELLNEPGIIRNRLKVAAVIKNAIAFKKISDEHGSFDTYLWAFVDGRPLQHSQQKIAEETSNLLSKSLQKHGCAFVGPTICYAFMQATGMINDHEDYCYRSKELLY